MAKVQSRERQSADGVRFYGVMANPTVAVVTITAPAGDECPSTCYLHAGVPGGRPMFSMSDPRRTGTRATPCADAPEVDSLSALLDFAVARFG